MPASTPATVNSSNNPYSAEINQLDQQIGKMRRELDVAQALLDKKILYSPSLAKSQAASLKKSIQQLKESEKVTPLNFVPQEPLLVKVLTFLADPGRFFEKPSVDVQNAEIKKLKDARTAALNGLRSELNRIHEEEDRVARIDEHTTRDRIRDLNSKLATDIAKLGTLKKRNEALVQRVGDLVSTADLLDQDIAEIEKNLAAAVALDLELGQVPESERYLVHNKCANLFYGESSPRHVINDLHRSLVGATRQKSKVTAKIQEEMRKLAVRISRVFIDGNNLCNKPGPQGQVFLGTAPVESLAHELMYAGYEVTVVFDYRLGAGDTYVPFRQVANRFKPGVRVEQAPSGSTADELLMAFATEAHDCILSNDRFIDLSYHQIVKDDRVFRVLITHNRVEVPFLNISAQFSS